MITNSTMQRFLNETTCVSDLPNDMKKLLYPVVARFVEDLKADPIIPDDKMYFCSPEYAKACAFVVGGIMKPTEFMLLFKMSLAKSADDIEAKLKNNESINAEKIDEKIFVMCLDCNKVETMKPI